MNRIKVLPFLMIILAASCQAPTSPAAVVLANVAPPGENAIVEISALGTTNPAYVNARVYDSKAVFLPGATIKVDGTPLVKQSYEG